MYWSGISSLHKCSDVLYQHSSGPVQVQGVESSLYRSQVVLVRRRQLLVQILVLVRSTSTYQSEDVLVRGPYPYWSRHRTGPPSKAVLVWSRTGPPSKAVLVRASHSCCSKLVPVRDRTGTAHTAVLVRMPYWSMVWTRARTHIVPVRRPNPYRSRPYLAQVQISYQHGVLGAGFSKPVPVQPRTGTTPTAICERHAGPSRTGPNFSSCCYTILNSEFPPLIIAYLLYYLPEYSIVALK